MRFTPPAYFPTGPDKPLFTMPFTMLKSQIEGWPRAIYEKAAWQAPVPGGALFVMEREAVKAVLQTQAANFPQGELFRRIMRPVWGNGLFVAEEKEWRAQRHAVSGAFRPADMSKLAPFFVKAAQTILARWKDQNGAMIDISQEMKRLTFDIVLETLLSGAVDFDRAEISRHTDILFNEMGNLRWSYLLAPDKYHKSRPIADVPSRHVLIDAVRAMISRRRNAPPQGDLVDLLFASPTPQTDEHLSDELVADNILGLIMAGYETTAGTLTWALYLIAAHQPTRARLLAEVQAVVGNGSVEAHHIAQLVFTRQVVQETMRLYPQAFSLTRVAREATELAGHKVTAGQRVNIPVYAIQRRAEIFPDPHVFDPDRFAPDKTAPDRFDYLPFGAGPRICLGAAFAMTEMVTVLATLVQGADFTPPPASAVWPVAQLSLKPKGGMPMGVSVHEGVSAI